MRIQWTKSCSPNSIIGTCNVAKVQEHLTATDVWWCFNRTLEGGDNLGCTQLCQWGQRWQSEGDTWGWGTSIGLQGVPFGENLRGVIFPSGRNGNVDPIHFPQYLFGRFQKQGHTTRSFVGLTHARSLD